MEIVLTRKWMNRLRGTHLVMTEQKALELIDRGTASRVQDDNKKPKARRPHKRKKVQKDKMMRTSPVIKG